MKRIFIVQNTPLNEPLPLSVYLTGLLSNFKRNKDYEINLIVSKSNNLQKEIKDLCNEIYQFPSSTYSIKENIKFSFFVKSILKKENNNQEIDIVHCFYPNSSLLGAVLFKKFNNKNAKIIYDIRSPWIEMSIKRGHVKKSIFLYKKILYTEEKILCKFVDRFIFITEGLKEHYLKTFISQKNPKIYVSPSGVDLKLFRRIKSNIRERYGIKKEEILIGHIGSVDKSRKMEDFLDLFAKLPKHIKLMLIGKNEDLVELTKNFNDKRIILVDKISHGEIPKYISTFDFGLCHLPNVFIYENSFPLKILEYLACGVPVLASELKAHREISKKLKGVFIYKNVKDIIRLMKQNKKVIINPNLKQYSWKEISKKYRNLWMGK